MYMKGKTKKDQLKPFELIPREFILKVPESCQKLAKTSKTDQGESQVKVLHFDLIGVPSIHLGESVTKSTLR